MNIIFGGKMSTIHRIVKNVSLTFIAQFLVSLLSMLLSVYIARKLGDIYYGKYSFVNAYIAIFTIFTDLGYNTLMLREISRNREEAAKYLNNVLSMSIFLSTLIYILIIIVINLTDYPVETKNITYILGLSLLIQSVADRFRLVFRSFEKMEYEALTRISIFIIKVFFGTSILYLGYGLIELSVVFLMSSILDVIINVIICRNKFLKPQIEFDVNFFKSTIRKAIVFSTLPVFSIIFLKIDTVMLSIIKGDAPVGWYNAAYSLVLGFQPIPSLFMNCLFPMMSNCYGSSKETLKIIYEKSFRYMFILGLPAAIGITLLSEKIILNFYGNQYINSIVILQILAWDTLLIFIRKPLDMLLISMNREKKVNIFLMTTAVLNIILNLVFIPFFSGIGAAMTTIICEFVLFLIYLHSISKYFHNLPIFTLTIHSIISSIVMAGSIYYLKNLNLILLIICSGIIYFAVFYLIGGFLKEEIKLIKNIKKDFLGDLSKLAAKD